MERLKPKRGNIVIYIVLLILTAVVMLMLKNAPGNLGKHSDTEVHIFGETNHDIGIDSHEEETEPESFVEFL